MAAPKPKDVPSEEELEKRLNWAHLGGVATGLRFAANYCGEQGGLAFRRNDDKQANWWRGLCAHFLACAAEQDAAQKKSE